MVNLTVLMGPPGAGKTTWVEANPQPGRVLCSTERIRVDRAMRGKDGAIVAYLTALRAKARRALQGGYDVLVDGCNTRVGDRTGWLRVARECGATPELVVFHAPLSVLLDVQRNRGIAGASMDKMHTYYRDYQHGVRVVGSEGWARIVHVHRNGRDNAIADAGPQPKRISAW